jgi:CRISPR/Cas system CSM-associated protein Csm3 (group 7 of RAMP superfamily)
MGSRGYGLIKFATRKVTKRTYDSSYDIEDNPTYKEWLSEFVRE